ncbi:hypothetical protein [Flavobacterium sp.]|uniref:hypothetical protein n=1 Tax=Flavobacterium sp. TaxID=239 RepID=UPI00262175AB|nr:hypothetical protein [Flavobacterium sp.]
MKRNTIFVCIQYFRMKIKLILLLFSVPIALGRQKKGDSLINVLRHTKNDIDKVRLLNVSRRTCPFPSERRTDYTNC